MWMTRTVFGSYGRARDGCIVTFRMPDGSIEVRRFTTVISDSRRHGIRRGQYHTEQVIEWADEHEAKIISMSTPETILRDLQGTRAILDPHRTGTEGRRGGMQANAADHVSFPERYMLRERGDLFERPGVRL